MILWWCVKMFSACASDVLVIFTDVLVMSWACLGDV